MLVVVSFSELITELLPFVSPSMSVHLAGSEERKSTWNVKTGEYASTGKG